MAASVALGHTNAEVADILIVSVRTVETYRAHLFRKLGVHTRAELVRAAKRTGSSTSRHRSDQRRLNHDVVVMRPV